MDSVRLCDYRLIHTNTKEHRETPVTWAEPLEHSDLVPLGAATGQWPVHCQWVRPTGWVNSRISPDQLADWRGMLPTDHRAEYEMSRLKKQMFRGRTRSNKERDKIQLEGKRVEKEIKEASCTLTGWWSVHLSARHLVTTASSAFLLNSDPDNFPGWKALYSVWMCVWGVAVTEERIRDHRDCVPGVPASWDITRLQGSCAGYVCQCVVISDKLD